MKHNTRPEHLTTLDTCNLEASEQRERARPSEARQALAL